MHAPSHQVIFYPPCRFLYPYAFLSFVHLIHSFFVVLPPSSIPHISSRYPHLCSIASSIIIILLCQLLATHLCFSLFSNRFVCYAFVRFAIIIVYLKFRSVYSFVIPQRALCFSLCNNNVSIATAYILLYQMCLSSFHSWCRLCSVNEQSEQSGKTPCVGAASPSLAQRDLRYFPFCNVSMPTSFDF